MQRSRSSYARGGLRTDDLDARLIALQAELTAAQNAKYLSDTKETSGGEGLLAIFVLIGLLIELFRNREKSPSERSLNPEEEKNISSRTNGLSLLTIISLSVSILVSFLIKNTVIVIVVFIISLSLFVYNTVKVKRETVAEIERVNRGKNNSFIEQEEK